MTLQQNRSIACTMAGLVQENRLKNKMINQAIVQHKYARCRPIGSP